MAVVQPIQNSFRAGEISPRLRGQTTSEKYREAVDICENFLPRPQGPLDFRGSFRHVSLFDDGANREDIRAYGMNIEALTNFLIVVGGEQVRVYDRAGPVIDGLGGVNQVRNGYFAAATVGWSEQVDLDGEVGFDPDAVAATLTTTGAISRARLAQSVGLAASAGFTHQFRLTVRSLPGTTSMLVLKYGSVYNSDAYGSTVLQPGNDILINALPGVDFPWITFEASGGSGTWYVHSVELRRTGGVPSLDVAFPSPWASFDRAQIRFITHPTAGIVVMMHPNVPSQQIFVDSLNVWKLIPVPWQNAPAVWTGTNWPACGAYAQNRFIVGGTPNEPTTVWGSKTDEYSNFFQGTDANDGFERTLARRGRITWISGSTREILVGTEKGEQILTSQGPVVTPSDVEFRPQSAYGSFLGQTEDVGERVIYVSGGEQRLRSAGYRFQEDAWVGLDLAWASEHITRARLRDIVYSEAPEQEVWANTRVGRDLVVCAYDREQDVIGWARCPTPDRVEAIAKTRLVGADEIWVVSSDEVGQLKVGIYTASVPGLDSFVEKVYAASTMTITGLDHLNGLEVMAWTDGAVQGPFTVSNGSVELDAGALVVRVGRHFTGQVRTLPVEGSNQEGGTAQGRLKRWVRTWLRVNGSAVPRIDGADPYDREILTPMDTAEPLRTTDYEVRVDQGWDRAAQVTVEAHLPLPMQIVGLFGELASE